jgi:hypothetical protein
MPHMPHSAPAFGVICVWRSPVPLKVSRKITMGPQVHFHREKEMVRVDREEFNTEPRLAVEVALDEQNRHIEVTYVGMYPNGSTLDLSFAVSDGAII